MKKIFTLMAVCAMALAANAQIVSSSSRRVSTQVGEYPNYNRLYVSYAPMSFSGDYADDMETATGVALGWLGGWNVSKSAPLYVETGINVKYNHMNIEDDEDGYYEETCKADFLSLNVPVNLSYKYSFPNTDGLSIAPYLGFHLTGNLLGKEKYEVYDDEHDVTISENKYDYFDKDDMGSDYTAKRIQFGWQIGVGLNYKALYVGVGYSAEFTEYMKKVHTGGVTLTLGLNF